MLTEGRKTIGRVRALLEDILRPHDNLSALTTVLVHATDDQAKDVKELNFGYRSKQRNIRHVLSRLVALYGCQRVDEHDEFPKPKGRPTQTGCLLNAS